MDIAQIILEAIILILGLYLVFFKSYFHEKGKNIATKEDIEEITNKIETIKNEIHFTSEAHFSLKMEGRKALIKYYEDYSYWYHLLINTDFGGIFEDNQEKLNEIEIKMEKAYFNYELSAARMNLFVDSGELTKKTIDLRKITYDLQKLNNDIMGDVAVLIVEMEKVKDDVIDEKAEIIDYQKVINKSLEIVKEHNSKKLDLAKIIAPIIVENKNLIFNILQTMYKE